MSAIQRVLFPIDLSLDYRTLSAATRKMFDRRNVEIVILHAIERASHSGRGTKVARYMTQMESLARKEFEFARVSRRVEWGRPADCILDCARSSAADAIVMPAGGLESLCRNSLGHVTDEVLAEARCAVWIEWMTGSVESSDNICCAVSLDGTDEAVVCRAAEFARDFGAELTIVHAVAPESPMLLWWDADAFEHEVRIARMRVDELRERFAPEAHLHVEAGRVDRVVSQALHRLNAGLLVTARREAIAAAAMACPVLRIEAVAHAPQMERAKTFASAGAA
jgi:nucleotide-binding universal stress UspA family protein